MTHTSPSPRPKAIGWRFAVGVFVFPMIGGIALMLCLGLWGLASDLIAGQGLPYAMRDFASALQGITSVTLLAAFMSCLFGTPVAAVVGAIGHFTTPRGPVSGASLGVIAGLTAYFALVFTLSGGALAYVDPLWRWGLMTIPISAGLGWAFARWVYPVRPDEAGNTTLSEPAA